MDVRTLFGLPAHPLFVHIPVVLLPLVGIGVIAVAISPRFRNRFGWLVVGLSIVAGISTQLAIGSGQALEDSVRRSAALRRHTGIAESIRPLALLLFLVLLAIMLWHRRAQSGTSRTPRSGRPVQVLLAGLAVVVAVGTNVRLWQIGDSGAKATWGNVHLRSTDQGEASRGGG